MLPREMTAVLLQSASTHSVVTVVGPRGAGKTTLVTGTFPERPLVNLEDPAVRDAAEASPRSFLAGFPDGALIDEVVLAPALLPLLRQVAECGPPGRFVLTASHEPPGHETLADDLGERARMLTLWPFTAAELRGFDDPLSDLDLVVLGSFPHRHNVRQKPEDFYEYSLDLFFLREGLAAVDNADRPAFRRFLAAVAGRVGTRVSLPVLAREADCPSRLVRRWLDLLRWSYLVAELPAAAKKVLWFTDTGFAAFLLGIRTTAEAAAHPLREVLLRNLAVTEAAKAAFNRGQLPGPID